jgi:hypothetical protein
MADSNETVVKSNIANGRQSIVVESRVRDVLERNEFKGIRLDGEFIGAASAKAEELILAAARRAKANGRSTIRPDDL